LEQFFETGVNVHSSHLLAGDRIFLELRREVNHPKRAVNGFGCSFAVRDISNNDLGLGGQ
jgi:hypothetical protein